MILEIYMKYSSQDVSELIEEVEGHDDVIGHCSFWFPGNVSVCNEDFPTGEDR